MEMLKTPPHDLRAEQALIGSIFYEKDILDELTLVPEDFYRNAHVEIYSSMENLYKNGSIIDVITLSDELGEELDSVGGINYLHQLMDEGILYQNFKHWEKIIKEKSRLRKQIKIATDVLDMAYSGQDATDKLKSLDDIENQEDEGFSHIGDIVGEVANDMQEYQNSNELVGLQTGLIVLDYYLDGLKSGDITFIAARPSIGKTAFMLEMASGCAKRKAKAAIFSLEMKKKKLGKRILVNQARINMDHVKKKRLNDEHFDQIQGALGKIYTQKIYIDDQPIQTVNHILRKCKRLKKKHGLDVVFIDYLQLLEPAQRFNSDVAKLTYDTRMLKIIARELDVHVVCLSQLSRKVEERANKRPVMADLRGSGSIEQDKISRMSCINWVN